MAQFLFGFVREGYHFYNFTLLFSMNYGLLLRTVIHLRPTQVYHQIKYRLVKPQFKVVASPISVEQLVVSGFKTEPIQRYHCLEGKKFTFLNLSHEFAGWNYNEYGNLWTYNQNYFDWLNQPDMSAIEGVYWIDLFNSTLTTNSQLSTLNSQLSLDPYPIALRSINWIKFFLRYPETVTKERLDSLYSQVCLLDKKLEYHLLANHLLEDSYALYISAAYFQDERFLKKATKLLLGQLKEQILPDGAHYEQSVMYHCILLDRLLDCINIGERGGVNGTSLRVYASKMLGHLQSIIYSDGSIPMVNDAAEGIAPKPEDIFDYAQRLFIKWEPLPLKECGYRRMSNGRMEATVDVGNITATYQPGHTHADSLNYELRIDGRPVVVDTGVSTYEKNERRQYERGTSAHNCVVVDSRNSSEVWGGFRVGRRCNVRWKKEEGRCIEASHFGFGKECRRRFEMDDQRFLVEDWFDGEAISYIHLVEGTNPDVVEIENAIEIEKKECQYSTEYNTFHKGTVLEIHFRGHLKTRIKL